MNLRLACPHCRVVLRMAKVRTKVNVKCPKCGQAFKLPADSGSVPPPAAATENATYSFAPDEDAPLVDARVPTPEELAEPHPCPVCATVLPAGAVLCVRCGYHLIRRAQLKGAAAGAHQVSGQTQFASAGARAYGNYRQTALVRLDVMIEKLKAARTKSLAALRQTLSTLADDVRALAPPDDLHNLMPLAKSNVRTLKSLADVVPLLADQCGADLALTGSEIAAEDVRDGLAARLEFLATLLRRLGSKPDQKLCLGFSVHLGPDARRYRDGGRLTQELEKALAKKLRQRGVSRTLALADDGGTAMISARRLSVHVEKWEERVYALGSPARLIAESRIQYFDDDATKRYSPTDCECIHGPSSSYADGDAAHEEYLDYWADDLLDRLPREALKDWDLKWIGVPLACPNCGHPHFVVERSKPSEACLSCGRDAYTGLPEELLAEAQAAANSGCLSVGVLLLAGLLGGGVWLWRLFDPSLPFTVAWLVTGLAGLGFLAGIVLLAKSIGKESRIKAKQEACRKEFKHPEYVQGNEEKLEKAGARKTNVGTVAQDALEE